ncbi:Anthocyanidin 3-O-glucoside 5-O-glucosyltransferase [Spatholobus suberectus]|nr:Anthocyanidin 3-O-glucoside 5-O-glucosyltransferase [Spatholobus suberectus]
MFRHRFLLILYPAQGHINPAFQFAKRLVSLGAHVTVSTTLYMHRRITNKPTLPALCFLPFSDGYDDEQLRDLDVETKPRILVNTFEALEAEALRAVDEFNMIPIGPLIPSALLDGKDPADTSFGGDIFRPANGCDEWLDSKPEMSVVYVSFGSFCVLSKTQMEELARALLDCGSPFLQRFKLVYPGSLSLYVDQKMQKVSLKVMF